MSRDVSDEEIKDIIRDAIYGMKQTDHMSLAEREETFRLLFYEVRRLGILEELVSDSSVTEIMVNGVNDIFIERDGVISKWDRRFESQEKLRSVIQQIVAKSNRVVNEASPIVDARLENGARVNVVMNPVAINGPILTIRRFPDDPISMKDLTGFSSITPEAAEYMKRLVIAGYNIFVSGGTGSGKTTFLNALSEYIPHTERIITIEDSAELQIRGIDNLVSLETRNANVEGLREISIRDLIKTSLRMRPDRIIVGEIRDGAALDFLSAANTGHDGSLCTGHANSAKDMLSRIETMVLMGMDLPLPAIRRQMASAIDIIVHLGRLRDRSRKVLEITEMRGLDNGEFVLNPIFEFKEEGEEKNGLIKGSLKKTGRLAFVEKLQRSGLYDKSLI
ncbi:MAG: CpaF family protein [Lachnospiraceae bacterium]|nr:CpaF family protein [Lachnospiraceae bacterium]MCR5411199.1 CpaF family protein [Lachnospiraceae bacterium]